MSQKRNYLEPGPTPDYRPSDELPALDKSGAEIFAEGYVQTSNAYCRVADSPLLKTDEQLMRELAEKSPVMARHLDRYIRRVIEDYWVQHAAQVYGLTHRQFAEFKQAQRGRDLERRKAEGL